MINPWKAISSCPPYVLDEDRPFVAAFNRVVPNESAYRINLQHTPEPRLGPVGAPVILLQLNPSFNVMEPNGTPDQRRLQLDLASIRDEQHAHLGVVADDGWWTPRLSELSKAVDNREKMARGICSIEFFPYRSRSFGVGAVRLPSQGYTFNLVRAALERGAIFLVTRNLLLWTVAVPELGNQIDKTVFPLSNPRSTYFTDRNLPTGVFDKVVDAISNRS